MEVGSPEGVEQRGAGDSARGLRRATPDRDERGRPTVGGMLVLMGKEKGGVQGEECTVSPGCRKELPKMKSGLAFYEEWVGLVCNASIKGRCNVL